MEALNTARPRCESSVTTVDIILVSWLVHSFIHLFIQSIKFIEHLLHAKNGVTILCSDSDGAVNWGSPEDGMTAQEGTMTHLHILSTVTWLAINTIKCLLLPLFWNYITGFFFPQDDSSMGSQSPRRDPSIFLQTTNSAEIFPCHGTFFSLKSSLPQGAKTAFVKGILVMPSDSDRQLTAGGFPWDLFFPIHS